MPAHLKVQKTKNKKRDASTYKSAKNKKTKKGMPAHLKVQKTSKTLQFSNGEIEKYLRFYKVMKKLRRYNLH